MRTHTGITEWNGDYWCDSCGKRVRGITIVNGMDFCAKCYQEIFGETEKDRKIADLEAKLAESEKQIKDARETANMSVDSWCKNRRKYEAQIAEMQNKSFILYSMLYEILEKQGCENVSSQIDQMTGWTYDKEADWLKGNRNYYQLKQQLAEKDKEIEYYKKQVKKFNNEAQKYFEDAYCNDFHNQDKISFALEQLEKVKKDIDCYMAIREGDLSSNIECLLLDFADKIDNQIKAIKEGK